MGTREKQVKEKPKNSTDVRFRLINELHEPLKDMAKKEIPYTEAMAEIEKIMTKLRGENIDIDTLTAEVKRASELIEMCKQRLRTTEEEVRKLFNDEQ